MKFCLNFMQKEGKHIRSLLNFSAEKNEAVRPELPRMAVVSYSSDVLCMHKTRLQLLYTDVQQLKKVQMVSPPHFFLRFYLFCLMCLSACWKKCAKFYLKFRTEGR